MVDPSLGKPLRSVLLAACCLLACIGLQSCSGGSQSGSPTPADASSTPTTTTQPTSGGGDTTSTLPTIPGLLAVHVLGSHFINALGAVVQLRGVNFSGFEFVAMQGYDPSDPTGGLGGQAGGPKWSAMKAWKANVVRLPLNEASWLGYACVDTGGATRNPDPGANYQAAVQTQVAQANAAGLYVILDLHWAAPGNACPLLQTQMADADHSLAFWTSVANTFKTNPAVLFELYNEPYFNVDFTGNEWSTMMQGTGGSFSGYPATDINGNWMDVKKSWAVASYQQMIDAVRATGALNVVLIGTNSTSADLSQWLAYQPNDPLHQMAAVWHAYPAYGAALGSAAYAQPNYAPQIFSEVQAILAAGIPVIATETGDHNTAGTVGAPLVSNVTQFADSTGISLLGWTWDTWNEPDDVLIKDVEGTPTDGYGVVFHDWLFNHG